MNDQNESENWPSKPSRRRTRFLKRRVVRSDNHAFVGRIYDLGTVALNFESYEQVEILPDCKYALETAQWVRNLADRVESLNIAGNMLWPKTDEKLLGDMPITRYQWLTIATDVFLVRYVSVIDCALLLVNQVFQSGLTPRACTIDRVAKAGVPPGVIDHLRVMLAEQEHIRMERNSRVHHGFERKFTDDDQAFKTASLFEDKYGGMKGSDIYGRKLNVELSFREGLVDLQRDFNARVRELESQLDFLYNILLTEFENRFGPMISSATHGFNANSRMKRRT